MTSKIIPQKPTNGNGNGKDEILCANQLASIPLKRRLEILFVSKIIPCRRQLALKYNLSEELIHNVLSHRRFILENWKYNGDSKVLLSKLELEKVMAMTELLMEWKRRVQLQSLQITDTALARKASYLQRVFKMKKYNNNNGDGDGDGDDDDKWWCHQFDTNWKCKRFRAYESDSLEMEDILHDLRWMFTENAFCRLLTSLKRQPRAGGIPYTRVGVLNIKTEDDLAEELKDVSDIKAETDYYNDDDFDCEDYEFILDEEAVIDALRKELDDAEQAKYERYMLDVLYSETIERPENEIKEVNVKQEPKFELNLEQQEKSDYSENELDMYSDNVQHRSPFLHFETDKLPISSIEPLPEPLLEPSRAKTRARAQSNSKATVTIPNPKPKRKPRNSSPLVSLRKDYVRMPTVTEISHLVRKECVEKLILESDISDTDGNDFCEQLFEQEMQSGMIISNTEEILAEDDSQQKINLSFNKPTNDFEERNNNDSYELNAAGSKELFQSTSRCNRMTSSLSLTSLNNDIILKDEVQNLKKKKSNTDIEQEITGTKIQRKGKQNFVNKVDSIPNQYEQKRCNIKGRHKNLKPSHSNKNSITSIAPTKQNDEITKRAKRRTDDSDLTLRKDKVRLNVVRMVLKKEACVMK